MSPLTRRCAAARTARSCAIAGFPAPTCARAALPSTAPSSTSQPRTWSFAPACWRSSSACPVSDPAYKHRSGARYTGRRRPLKKPWLWKEPRFLRPLDARNAHEKCCGIRLWGSAPNPGRGMIPLHPTLCQQPTAPGIAGAALISSKLSNCIRLPADRRGRCWCAALRGWFPGRPCTTPVRFPPHSRCGP